MSVRIVHLFVICALVFAAAYVYRIKMESTVRTERVVQLRADIREQREAIASLHAEWAKLETPGRMQDLATRYLSLKPVEAMQYDQLKNLPPRPPNFIRPDDPDPIGSMIDTTDKDGDKENVTGSVPSPEDRR